MLVLVTGGTGTLGRAVVGELLARAHAVRVLTRRPTRVGELATPIAGDIRRDAPVAEAVDGVDAIVHCATDPSDHRSVDAHGTARLVELAARAGSPHVVFPGIVGSDVVPLRFYRSKMAAEECLQESELATTIVRATHFHEFVWSTLERLRRLPVLPVPNDTRLQPIDRVEVARHIVDRVDAGPVERIVEIGGPSAYEAVELARSHRAATGHGRRILPLNVPGITGAAFRAGAALTPTRLDGGRTWNDFVAAQLDPTDGSQSE